MTHNATIEPAKTGNAVRENVGACILIGLFLLAALFA